MKKREEIAVPGKRLVERAPLAEIVPAYAFEREIEPVCNLSVEPPGTVDGVPSINPVPRKHNHAADRIADSHERVILFLREQLGDVFHRLPSRKRRDYGVAAETELAEFGAVVKVRSWRGVIENK